MKILFSVASRTANFPPPAGTHVPLSTTQICGDNMELNSYEIHMLIKVRNSNCINTLKLSIILYLIVCVCGKILH